MPDKTFEDALAELVDEYDGTEADTLISALEIQIMMIKEAQGE